MRHALWLAFLFAAAVLIALFASANEGHVTIYFPPYRVDLSFNLLIGLLVGLFIVTVVAWRTFAAVLDVPRQAAAYRKKRREAQAMSHIAEAIAEIFAGRFSKALKAAQAASANDALADTAALLAARAAHRLNQFDLRDEWLEKITASDKQHARLVALADMQMDANDAQAALATIEQLQKGGGRQIFVQRIALRANQQLKRWTEVLRLTHSLSKHGALHPVLVQKNIQEAVSKLVQEKSTDHEALLKIWKTLPKEDRRMSRVALVMAKGLLATGQLKTARELIEESLDAEWDAALMDLYPECWESGESAVQQIQKLDTWMLKYPTEPQVSLALGRLCYQQKLWGKAKVSLQGVLKDARSKPIVKANAHLYLAQLHEALAETEEAAQHYRQAAKVYATL